MNVDEVQNVGNPKVFTICQILERFSLSQTKKKKKKKVGASAVEVEVGGWVSPIIEEQ